MKKADKIKKAIMLEYKLKGWACIPEMHIGDLAHALDKNKTGLISSRERGGEKGAYSMIPDIWLVSREKKITIVEVKSSRQDFKSDKKWHIYQQFCDLFYFAIDGDYISKEELPKGVGLIKLDDSKRGFTFIKKAFSNKVDIPDDVYSDLMFRMARSMSNRQEILKETS
jgi:hypothetical protein